MKTQRFRLRNSNQVVYVMKSTGRYSEVLLPFVKESRKGMLGTIMTVKNENLIEEKSGGYSYG